MARIARWKSFISQHLIHQISKKVIALAAIAVCGVVLWQLGLAQQARLRPRAAAPTSPAAVLSEQKVKPLPPYNLAAINSDSAYYQRADAARIHQMAPIPPGQKRHEELQIVGEPLRLALPDSWLEQPLVVRAKPGRPVTFVALDSGKFANDEITITVKADAQGLAAAKFYVPNEGEYRVLAGSPENAGPAQFGIRCVTKAFRDDLESGRYAQQYLAKQRAAEKQRIEANAKVFRRIQRKQLAQ